MINFALFAQNVVAALVVGYIAFCLLYGRKSLKARREGLRSVQAGGAASWDVSLRGLRRSASSACALLLAIGLPAIVLVALLTVSGRERVGVVEASNLFVVEGRNNAAVTYLTSQKAVEKGDRLASFTSDTLKNRISALYARKKELVALRDALRSKPLADWSVGYVKYESSKQKLTQAARQLGSIESAIFDASQRLLAARSGWQNTHATLSARIPQLEQALASLTAEYDVARAALTRISALRTRGYATVTQLETRTVAATVLRHRLETAREDLRNTRRALAAGQRNFIETETLIRGQLGKFATQKAEAAAQHRVAAGEVEILRDNLGTYKQAAETNREHELVAARARLAKLDAEIASAAAEAQITSPVAGRVIYRNPSGSSLRGALPMLVVAADEGFAVRVRLRRDEIPALQKDALSGRVFKMVLTDGTARSFAAAKLKRIAKSASDPEWATAIFGVNLPEDMLVRMAQQGRPPRGALAWAPSSYDIVLTKIADAFGSLPLPSVIAKPDAPDLQQPVSTEPAPAKALPAVEAIQT